MADPVADEWVTLDDDEWVTEPEPAAAAPSKAEQAAGYVPAAAGLASGLIRRAPGGALLMGGAEGARQLLQHGAELPGAVADVGRNLIKQPGATVKGYFQGAAEGLQNAAGAATGGAASGLLGGALLTKRAARTAAGATGGVLKNLPFIGAPIRGALHGARKGWRSGAPKVAEKAASTARPWR